MKKIICILIFLLLIGNVKADTNGTLMNNRSGYFIVSNYNGSYNDSFLNLTQEYIKAQSNMTNITTFNTSTITLQKLATAVQQEAYAIQLSLKIEKAIYNMLRYMLGV